MTVMRFDTVSQAGKACNMPVVVSTQLPGKSDPRVLYRSGTSHGESEPPFGTIGQPVVLVIAQYAIGTTLQIGEWCKHEAIFEFSAVVQEQGIRELGSHGHSYSAIGAVR